MKIETLAVHAGHTIDPTTGAVTPPIHLSTTFERDVDGSYPHGFMYARNSNPNRDALERGVAALEGGAAAAAFASGIGRDDGDVSIARARRSRCRARPTLITE